MRSCIFVVALGMSVLGCRKTQQAESATTGAATVIDSSEDSLQRTIVSFLTRRLAGDGPEQLERTDTIWSQNDDVDSVVAVLVTDNAALLEGVTVDLIGRPGFEADGPEELPSTTVKWLSLSNIRIDSLISLRSGSRLVSLRPSALQERFEAISGGGMLLDTVRVTVRVSGHRATIANLMLLWD